MLEIKLNSDGYFIVLRNTQYTYFSFSGEIANHLNIDPDEYFSILLSHGARYTFGLYIFWHKQDAEEAIKELEPYVIMRKLC